MKNKKGFLIGEHTVEIVVAVLVIIVLVYLGYRAYAGVTGKQTEKIAKGELDKIITQINLVRDREVNEAEIIIHPPENWYLRSDDVAAINDAECLNRETCLCFCEGASCDNLKVCEGFDFEVEVEGSYTIVLPPGGPGAPASTLDQENTVEFKKASAELRVYEDDKIKIEKIAG